MIKLILNEAIEAMGGRVRDAAPTVSVVGVSTDSRSVVPGELFFALRGERFDGHDYAVEAARRGAIGVVAGVSRAADVAAQLAAQAPDCRTIMIATDDPEAALGRLAGYHRRLVTAKVIAVVGSNGKTTTKAMIAHVLAGSRPGRCSPKSFNNAVGVPLTLLSAEAADEFLVVEIGTNAPGEVAALGAMAQPDMAVITSIAEEHLAGLGDLNGVAAEEASILTTLRRGGFAAVTAESPELAAHLATDGVTVATFGRDGEADLRLTAARYDPPWLNFTVNGRFPYRLRMAGMHNALNAAGAILIARRMKLEHEQIAERLETFEPPPMRGEIREIGGVTVVNDAYNANPGSARAALELLAALPCRGRRIAVIGEMRELGRHTAALHLDLAKRMAREHIDLVLLVGAAGDWMHDALANCGAGGPAVERCAEVDACAERLADVVRAGDVVLLKASRAVGLERVLTRLAPARATPVAV